MRNRTITVTKRSLTLSPLDVVWAPATRSPIPMRLGGFCDSDCGLEIAARSVGYSLLTQPEK